MTSALEKLPAVLLGFEEVLEAAEKNKPMEDSTHLAEESREKENNASEVIGAVCLLGRRFLHAQPALFLSSDAFIVSFQVALG